MRNSNIKNNQEYEKILSQKVELIRIGIPQDIKTITNKARGNLVVKRKSSFRLFIFLLIISLNAFAQQGAEIKYVNELAQEDKVLIHNYRGVFTEEEIKNVEKLDSEHSKIVYARDKVNYEAVVNSDMKDLLIVATCKEIPKRKLPAIVKDGFHTSKYGNNKIKKAFSVTTPYSSNFYRIDVQLKEKKEKSMKSLFYDDKGLYKEPPY